MTVRRRLAIATALALGLAAAGAAQAAQATLTLSRDVALWNDVVVAHIEGTGCSGGAEPPSVAFHSQAWFVDIDLQGCNLGPAAPFSVDVPLGPLFPGEYTVHVHDIGHHIVDTAPLSVHPDASLGIEVLGVPTDAAPLRLVLSGLASSNCFSLEPPSIEGQVITAHFDDYCAIISFGGEHVFREEFPVGPLPAGVYEVRFFDATFPYPTLAMERLEFTVHEADRCVPSDAALCLQGGRFRVEAAWTDFAGHTGVGHPIPLDGDSNTGLLWFFSADNVELTVKVLDGCALNGHRWVFLSSGSTVGYTVTVTDTLTGQRRTYTNDSGEAAPLVTDTSAFPCGG